MHLKAHKNKSNPDLRRLTVKCDFEGCPKMFKSRPQMLIHHKVHEPKPIYSCDWEGCEYSTNKHAKLKNHKLYHTYARTYQCDFEGCNRSFVTLTVLRKHKSRHFKRFVCSWPECGHTCSDNRSLKSHQNTHLNVRPFKCYINEYNKDFTTDDNLKNHLRYVHKIKAKDII